MATSNMNGALDKEVGMSPVTLGPRLVKVNHERFDSLSSMSSTYSYDLEKSTPVQPAPEKPHRFNPRTWSLRMRIFASIGLFLALAAIVISIAVPLTMNHQSQVHLGHHQGQLSTGPTIIDPPAPNFINSTTPLRIMPLGASITFGFLSTDGNGYRDVLRNLLIRGGNTNITYVGSRHNGTMADNAVEGWPGYRIEQVWAKANASVPRDQPNIVLLNAGTNDAVQDWNLDSTTKPASAPLAKFTADKAADVGQRMRLLVEDLFVWAPDTTVVMSTLVLNKEAPTNARVDDANVQFRRVAAELQAEGRRVVLADMSTAAGGPNETTMADATHPDDVGYAMMANRWYVALVEAAEKGLIMK